MTNTVKMLASISKCDDPEMLRSWIANARKKGDQEIIAAAFRRLISIVPNEKPGSVEYDFWQMINAFEFALREEHGKTVRLSRTRQKVKRDGVIETLKDWATKPNETSGFAMLIELGMPEYTGEAIVLRHPDKFDAKTIGAAQMRLTKAGINTTGSRSEPESA